MGIYAKIASEQNQFNFNDVIEAVCNKLVYRHPHIYSNVKVSNEQEVKEKILRAFLIEEVKVVKRVVREQEKLKKK